MKEPYNKDKPTISFEMDHQSVVGKLNNYKVEIYTHCTPKDRFMKGMIRVGLVGADKDKMSEAEFIWNSERYALPRVKIIKSGLADPEKFNKGKEFKDTNIQKAKEFICSAMGHFQGRFDEYHPSKKRVSNFKVDEDSMFGKIEKAVADGHIRWPHTKKHKGKIIEVSASVVNFKELKKDKKIEMCEYKNWLDAFRDTAFVKDYGQLEERSKLGKRIQEENLKLLKENGRISGVRVVSPQEVTNLGIENSELEYRMCTTIGINKSSKTFVSGEEYVKRVLGVLMGTNSIDGSLKKRKRSKVNEFENENPVAIQKLIQKHLRHKPVELDIEDLKKRGLKNKDINQLLNYVVNVRGKLDIHTQKSRINAAIKRKEREYSGDVER